jgi:hypothetical protein
MNSSPPLQDLCFDAVFATRAISRRAVEQLGIARVSGRMPLFEIGLTPVPGEWGRSTAWRFEEVVTVSHHDPWFHATEHGAAPRFNELYVIEAEIGGKPASGTTTGATGRGEDGQVCRDPVSGLSTRNHSCLALKTGARLRCPLN